MAGLRAFIAAALAAGAVAFLPVVGARAAGSSTEPVYFNDATYQIETGAATILAGPNLLAKASPMYLIRFPVAPGTTGPITLPSGYQPQSNGLPTPDPYHDHVHVAIPGLGTDGTAGAYKPPLRIVRMQYTWAYAYSPTFVPIRSVSETPRPRRRGSSKSSTSIRRGPVHGVALDRPGSTDHRVDQLTVARRPILSTIAGRAIRGAPKTSWPVPLSAPLPLPIPSGTGRTPPPRISLTRDRPAPPTVQHQGLPLPRTSGSSRSALTCSTRTPASGPASINAAVHPGSGSRAPGHRRHRGHPAPPWVVGGPDSWCCRFGMGNGTRLPPEMRGLTTTS